MIYFDTETVGLHGVAVLIQYAIDDGPIVLFSPWTRPIKETLALIEMFCTHPGGVCAYNIAFDWFHLQKLHNLFSLFDPEWYPDLHIEEIVAKEREAIWGPCIKPVTALDLMLHAVKGPYQSVMERKDIVIRKVPSILADRLCTELTKKIPMRDIYFSRKQNKAQRWQVMECREQGQVLPNFKNVVLSFAASKGLKNIAIDAFNLDKTDEVLKFKDVELPKHLRPSEVGWAPFADAAPPSKEKGNKRRLPWNKVIHLHIEHWAYNRRAREYASLDVTYLRRLWEHFGKPEPGDDDSVLACSVASTRWRGYSINKEKIQAQIDRLEAAVAQVPQDPRLVKKLLDPHLTKLDWMGFSNSTNKRTLEELVTWTAEDENGKTIQHPAGAIAANILTARTSAKLLDMFKKILKAGRLHASFKVIGALSGRMSGADGLNPHGINRADSIRECFTFMDDGEMLSGGDFKSFEISIAEAEYKDPLLRSDLLSNKKVHALFGLFAYPDMTYDDIVRSDGSPDGQEDVYAKCKQCVFALMYGAAAHKIASILGISEEEAEKVLHKFFERYVQVGLSRALIQDRFCSMKQHELGGQVYWKDPDDYIESALGFRRYFTLENTITRELYNLACSPPKDWNNLRIKIQRRRDGSEQYVGGATRSALYAAAFGLQALNMRAACNHVIQAFGSSITKNTQRRVWDLQPAGICSWKVRPSNYHDELNVAHVPELASEVEAIVKETVESFRPIVPLIGIDWKPGMKDWSSKHGHATQVG